MTKPLRIRNFQLLSAGQFASAIGDYCNMIALPWFVLSSHGSTIVLGLVMTCFGVPRAALIPVGGMLADRLSPRTVMLFADAARFALTGVLMLLAARHSVSAAYLAPTAALIGASEGLFLPASYAIVPSLMDSTQLVAASSVFSAIQQAGSLIGPAVGGLVVAMASPTAAFGINAASFAVSAVTLAFITRGAAQPAPVEDDEQEPPQAGPDAVGGSVLRLVRSSRVLQIFLGTTLAANLVSAGLAEVALPDLAHQRFGAFGYGVLLIGISGGSIVGALAAARSDGLRRPAVFATLVFVAESLAVTSAPYLGALAGVAAALAMFGLLAALGNTIMMPRLQAWIPPEMIGRVMSLITLCAYGGDSISTAAGGVFVHHFGAAALFPIGGFFIGVPMLAALGSRQWRSFGAVAADASAAPPPMAMSQTE